MKNRLFNIKTLILSIVTASIFYSGCGSNGIDDVYALPEDGAISDYTVQVVDDDVLGATVMANECSGFEEKSDGFYILTGCSTRPTAIIASGGYVRLSDANVSMGFPMMLNTNMIKQSTSYTATPLTTLLATVDSYEELINLQKQLGFSSVQAMFEDSNATRDLQRTLNSFFIEAQNSGVDLNNFSDFTADFRQSIVSAPKGSDGLASIKNAKAKMKADFDANPDKYLKKYGIVFSGFVTSTDYKTGGSAALLKNIGSRFAGQSNSIVFSGFIYDDIIGLANKDENDVVKYKSDANITIKDLTTSDFLDLNVTVNGTPAYWVFANSYGQYKVDLNISAIIDSHTYLLKGEIETKSGKEVVLTSLLTGKEILNKFKAKLNTSDIPDVTITNVTTAKVALLELQDVNLTNVEDVIDGKQNIEQQQSTLLLDVATGIKTIIDGDANTTGDTFSYIKTKISATGTTFTPASDMEAQLGEFKAKITEDKTLSTQLKATTNTKFMVTTAKIKDQVIIFKKIGFTFKSKLSIFKNGTYIFDEKMDDGTPLYQVGDWDINSDGDLVLINTDANITTLIFSSLDMGKATFSNGKFTGMSESPKGRFVQSEGKTLFDVTNINAIDYKVIQPPMVKFIEADLKGKVFYEVYKVSGSSPIKYEDAYYSFHTTNKTVLYNADVKEGLKGNGSTNTWSISNGILTIDNDTFKIKQSYDTKLICKKNESNESIEFYYSAIKAAASKEVKTYSADENKMIDKFGISYWGHISSEDNNNPNHNTIVTDPFVTLKAIPLNGDIDNYKHSQIGAYLKTSTVDTPTKTIGIKTQITVTKNNGDSNRQIAGVNAKYYLPSCVSGETDGQFYVVVLAKNNKIQYMLKLKDSNGIQHRIYDKPIVILEENTLNVNYEIMILLVKNVIIIQVAHGENAYYQYIPLETLWSGKADLLKGYKYPTSYRNSYAFAELYDDGTEKYKGKSNAPVEVKMNLFKLVNGDETNNYLGGQSSLCSGSSSTEDTNTTSSPTNPATVLPTINWTDSSNEVDFWKSATVGNYDSLNAISLSDIPTTAYELEYRPSDDYSLEIEKVVRDATQMQWSELEPDGSWKNKNLDTFTISNNEITTTNNDMYAKVKFVEVVDATGLNNGSSIFTDGDKVYKLVVKYIADSYELYEKVRTHGNMQQEYYQTFSELIEYQSSSHWFMSKDGNYTGGGISFAENSSGTTGTLIEVDSGGTVTNNSAGTWEITTISGVGEVLIITPTIAGYKGSSTNPNEKNIFRIKDGFVYKGDYNKAGNEYEGFWFNESAKNNFTSYINAHTARSSYIYSGTTYTALYTPKSYVDSNHLHIQTVPTSNADITLGNFRITLSSLYTSNESFLNAFSNNILYLDGSDIEFIQFNNGSSWEELTLSSGSFKLTLSSDTNSVELIQNDAVFYVGQGGEISNLSIKFRRTNEVY